MRNPMAVPILQEVLEQRNDTPHDAAMRISRWLGIADVLSRSDMIMLAAELVIAVERIDQAAAGERAAELRRKLQSNANDDVLRSPYGRGKVG